MALRGVIVTGAGSGIGRRLVGLLAMRGDRVVAADIDQAALNAVALADAWPADRVDLRTLDVRDPQAWRALIDTTVNRYGTLDALLNVAGVLEPGLVHEGSPRQIDWHMDVNAKGVMYGTQAAAAVMVAARRGHIVNVASMAGLAAVPGLALYSASKWAVRGFTLAISQELAPHGVRVSVVCPDAVQTPMLDKQLDYREAAVTFSGPRALSVDEVCRAILDEALGRGRLEVMLPWRRGMLAKLSSFFPTMAVRLLPGLTRKGLARQEAARQQQRGSTPKE